MAGCIVAQLLSCVVAPLLLAHLIATEQEADDRPLREAVHLQSKGEAQAQHSVAQHDTDLSEDQHSRCTHQADRHVSRDS